MAKYSAQLVAQSSENKKVTTTLSNVNPETAPAKIKQFAQTLNALTTNTYSESNYIVTTNLDTEVPPVDTRPTPTLSLPNPPTLAQVQTSGVQNLQVSYDGDGAIYLKRISGCSLMNFTVFYNQTSGEGPLTFVSFDGGQSQTTGGKYVLGATGTDNYKPVEVEYTLA